MKRLLKKNKDYETLLRKIDRLQEKLVLYGLSNGLNDPKTIQLSQELDKYILLYQKMKYKQR